MFEKYWHTYGRLNGIQFILFKVRCFFQKTFRRKLNLTLSYPDGTRIRLKDLVPVAFGHTSPELGEVTHTVTFTYKGIKH